MIIQGSNSPIQIMFDDVTDIMKYSVSLIYLGSNNKEPITTTLKHWDTEDLKFEGNTVLAPLSESETLSFHPGVADLEIKWMDSNGDIYHAVVLKEHIVPRGDHTRMEDDYSDAEGN